MAYFFHGVFGFAVLSAFCVYSPAAELNILIWKNYLPDEVVKDFSATTGVVLNVTTYDTNESLLEKLKDQALKCDVCVPSDYMVATLIEESYLKPIDRSLVGNLKHLSPGFLNLYFDPDNKYSVPYLWGTAGLGYNKELAGNVDSWAVLFDPKNSGKVSMLDDARECFAVALKSLDKSVNTTDSDTLHQASAKLAGQKGLVKKYDSENYAELLETGEVAIAHGYSGELAQLAIKSPSKFGFVVPREGSTVSVDNLCVPTKAQNLAGAHMFIDYLLRPDVAAKTVNETGYASANEAAKQLVDPAKLANKGIYPDQAILSRCEYVEELGESGSSVGESSTVVDDAWKKIRSE